MNKRDERVFKNPPTLINCIECNTEIHASRIGGVCDGCVDKLLTDRVKLFRHYRISKAVHDFIAKLYADIPIDEFVDGIANILHHGFNFQRVIIYAYEPDKEQLKGFCATDVPGAYLYSLILPTHEPPATDYLHRDVGILAFQQNKTLIINDRNREEGYRRYIETIRAGGIPAKVYSRSFMMVPLKTKFGKVGVLGLYRMDGEHYRAITEEEGHSMEMLAFHIAATIDILFPAFYDKIYAITDALTGLYNRRYFDDRLKEELLTANRKGENIGLLMIDIDFFKKFNDTFGHQKGDEVLKLVSDTIKRHTRNTDVVSRYGGEEMTVILPKADYVHTRVVAERVRKGIEDIPDLEIRVSIGVAAFPEKLARPNAGEMIKSADDQLYRAKNTGRNRVCPE